MHHGPDPVDQFAGSGQTRSAITVAGSCGYAVNRAGIRGSTSLIADGTAARSYFGGPSLATVSLAMPSCRAMARYDKPSLR